MAYLSDLPLIDPRDDKLGRAAFGRRLARVIQGAQRASNTVIGLNGVFGSGKTTAINFGIAYLIAFEKAHIQAFAKNEAAEIEAFEAFAHVLEPAGLQAAEALHGKREFETVIIRYQPWLVSGRDALISDFFRLLGARAAEFVEGDLKSDIRRYAAEVADRTHKIAGGINTVSSVIAAVADLAGGGGAFSAGLGAAKTVATSVQGATGSAQRNLRESSDTTLDEARAKLSRALERSKKRFLVIIDDIDRLMNHEVHPVLSMVKSVGNLPNVTYLIAFDRTVVASVLDENADDVRPSFLEKIIQIDIDLPRPTPRILEKELLGWLEGLIGRELAEPEKKDFQDDFFYARSMLERPRDLSLLRNALFFLRSATDREIRITDAVRIELIRLKERRLFDWLIRTRQPGNEADMTSLQHQRDDNRNKFIEAGFSLASPQRRAVCETLIRKTFSEFGRSSFGGRFFSNNNLGWSLDSSEGWHAYTRLYPHEDTLQRDEWEELQAIASDEELCRSYLQGLVHRSRSDLNSMLNSLIEDLQRCFDPQIPPTGLLSALLKLDSSLWDSAHFLWGGSLEGALLYLVKLVPSAERHAFLLGILQTPDVPIGLVGLVIAGLGRPYRLVWHYSGQRPPELLTEQDVYSLATVLADRIEGLDYDDIGWACRLAPLLEIYRNRRGAPAAAELASNILGRVGRGGIGILLSLASSQGHFRSEPDIAIYSIEMLHSFAEQALQSGRFNEYQELLGNCIEWSEAILQSEASVEDTSNPSPNPNAA